jgi:hypothetical protein
MRFVRAILLLVPLVARPSFAAEPTRNLVGIDFSFAGFQGGGHAIPDVPAKISVRPSGSDDTALLQSAIDHVAGLPLGPDGFRGAVLLRPGQFHVQGQLHLNASGIVLRGSGTGSNRTIIVATGIGRRTLIQVGGEGDPIIDTPINTGDQKVEPGDRKLHLATTDGFTVGTHIVVRRPSTAEWIKAHGMSGLLGTFADQRVDWKPGSHDLVWDRTITAVDSSAKSIEIDAPVTFLMEKSTGGGTVAVVQSNAPLQNIGIENLSLESAYDTANPKDEEHSWIAIALNHVEDAWVRNVTARHFVSSAVRADQRARRITIQNCRSEAPISEEGGYRRQSFLVYGQQILIYHCHSEDAMNDFATGLLAAGPNVFLDCDATRSLEPSGAFEGLAAGVLYERVHVPDSRVQLLLDQTRAQAAGWTAVNSLIWNSAAKSLDAMGPYDGLNYVVDSPQPLYEAELKARGLHLPESSATPKVSNEQAPDFHEVNLQPTIKLPQHPLEIVNGYFVVDGKVAYGGSQSDAWWHGNTSPAVSGALTGSSITRFMPGQTAPGLTEDLNELVARAKHRGTAFYQTIPGLWYEHRRDEHTVTRQQNGDVWAPFFEMPWARSGKGIAWDGLSRFDLGRYNPWYFERNREFARIAGEQGIIVYHNLYNTHDVLEIGPHWIDYPWRPANNINDTGLPEPPPFKGGYTISMDTVQPTVTKLNVANEFYSVDYPPLRKLHHDYIFHVLDELGDMPNVIFTVAYQYAGPLAFEQFFQDTVAEWEKLHNHHVRIALITDKKITDAIMTDPVRSKQIAVVDMRYWYYLADGTLFAPEAGQNRAFRDMIASRFGDKYSNVGPPTTQEQLYRQVREYRDRYPNIALVPMENGAGPISILMGGGVSQSSTRTLPENGAADLANLSTDAIIDKFIHEYLAEDLMKLKPLDGVVADPEHNWVLAGETTDAVLLYTRAGSTITLTRSLPHTTYKGTWFDPSSGQTRGTVNVSGKEGTTIAKPDSKGWLLWLRAIESAI